MSKALSPELLAVMQPGTRMVDGALIRDLYEHAASPGPPGPGGGGIPEPTTAGNFLRTDAGTWVPGVTEPTVAGNFLRTNTGTWVAGALEAAGVPTGGVQWQVLGKTSAVDLNVAWQTLGARGNNSTAVGNQALAAHTTGDDNTALGNQAMMTLTVGAYNTAVGSGAFRTNLNGFRNTAVGTDALAVNTANDNTAIGYQALGASVSASNTAVGVSALGNTFFNSNSNVALGHSAGRYVADGVSALTGTNNSIFIGGGARASAQLQTNEIVIGVSAIGHGSHTATIGVDSGPTMITQLWCGGRDILTAILPTGINGAQVTLGDPDSGGTGFRALVVPN